MLIDLAAKRLGGMVVAANDEFFGAKENLLEPSPAIFDPLLYTDRGKVMDGWETRRRRDEGHDWCVLRLGVPGVIQQVVVDTSHFKGNFPQACEVLGAVFDQAQDPLQVDSGDWFPLLPRTDLQGDAVQRFDVTVARRVTHVRFMIHPDGGVARLQLLGRPLVELSRVADVSGRLDLAAAVNGGMAVACSDAFFSSPTNLIMVGDARNMGDGWETRRRRGPGHDWAVLRLCTAGVVERIEIDTTHFKGNYPDRCTISAIHAPGIAPEDLPDPPQWTTLVAEQAMRPHARHVFDVEGATAMTHLRLAVIPDGGVARLRAFGRVSDEGWRLAAVSMLDAAEPAVLHQTLHGCCGSQAWVTQMMARAPFTDPDSLLRAADEVWRGLDAADHLEAFAAHPRIGDRSGPPHTLDEQQGTESADRQVLEQLHDGNVAYEKRFGHVFLIRAAGRSAQEMLAALQQRLQGDPHTELGIAAEQQRQITALRLNVLLDARLAARQGTALDSETSPT
ncbi:MAG: allantoicase [Euzebya sp.]